MKKYQALFILLFVIIGIKVSAQDSPVPEGYILKVKDDYPKYEADVIKCVDWLQKTSWTDDPAKTKEVNTFIIAWISGSPKINVYITPVMTKLIDKNEELLVIYMGNYAKYTLLNKDNFDKDQANAAALRAMIEKYNNEPSHVKNKYMEKLTQTDKDGKLDDWIKTDFNKTS